MIPRITLALGTNSANDGSLNDEYVKIIFGKGQPDMKTKKATKLSKNTKKLNRYAFTGFVSFPIRSTFCLPSFCRLD